MTLFRAFLTVGRIEESEVVGESAAQSVQRLDLLVVKFGEAPETPPEPVSGGWLGFSG